MKLRDFIVEYGKEALAGLILAVGFLLMKFNPVSVDFSINILIGLAALAVFGSLVQISGIVNLNSYYLAPLVALGFLDIRAAGIFLFAFFGRMNSRAVMKNMITPKMQPIAKAAYAGYILFILISIGAIYSQIEFKIPGSVSNIAVELLVPAIGCDPSYMGQECLDTLVSETIDTQCKGNNACITLLNDQRPQMEEGLFNQLSSQFPGFSRNKQVRDVLTEALNTQIDMLVSPYQSTFKIVMAFVIFSVFQFLSGILSSISGGISRVILKVLLIAGFVKKKVVKVDKVRFSI